MKNQTVLFTKHRSRYASALLTAAVLLGSTSMHAQIIGPTPIFSPTPAGSLDPSFGRGGKVVTQFGGFGDVAMSIAAQPDGKLVAAGTTYTSGGTDFALARYNNDGTLDFSFGTGGRVTTDISGSYDSAASVAIQPDGKIVAAGWAVVNSIANFALARYNTDGTLDNTFGTAGKVVTNFNGVSAQVFGVVVQLDGKIVVAGEANVDGGEDFALARYNSDGTLDYSFGNFGEVATSFGSAIQGFSVAQGHALALQGDGMIVVAGLAFVDTGFDFAVARYNPNGTLDNSFGTGGKITTNFESDDRGSSVAIQPDGKIVVAGLAVSPLNRTPDFALVRYNPDGTLDATFGTGGKVTTDFGGSSDEATALAIRSDGRLVVTGQTFVGASFDFATARYNSDGTLDTTFGSAGRVVTSIADLSNQAFAIALEPDGKAVVAGSANHNGIPAFAIVRYQ